MAERLDRLVDRARAALFWEELWRALVPPLIVIGLFLTVSFAGLWLEVGGLWRMIGVGLFSLALVVSLIPFGGLGRPSRKDALNRIDRESGLAHHPATSLDDALANAGSDPATRALWRLHLQRMARNVENLRAGLPSPRVVDLDRYALRAGVLVALIAAAFIAGPEKYARIASAFDWRATAGDGSGYRVDAWIDPPPYTGKAPIILKLTMDGVRADQTEKVSVPTGSTVVIRSSADDLRLETTGALEDAAKAKQQSAEAKPAQPADPHEHRLILRGDAQLAIRHEGAVLGRFALSVIPDNPPRIEFTDVPRANLRGSLTLAYKIEDDYGVVGAFAEFTDPNVDSVTGRLRSLVPPPRIALVLPAGPGGLGETEMTTDLSDHPWAGARVKVTLKVTDEAGNDGKSDPIYITLPEKNFLNPLARALAEQRRNLVLYPDDRDRVEDALESLMIAPEVFSTKTSVYLGLDVATRMLQGARNDSDLIEVADFLWSMAMQIENGDLSDAERDLRAAEQALREALQRNAPDDEIRKLTENLRAAMDKYLNEFAKQQQQQQNAQDAQEQPQGDNNAKSISRKDLQAMLDRMQEMARAGDRANAQKMLEQLQNTLDNLAMARRQQADPTRQRMSRALNELDKMMREQQNLRDKTHRQAQQQSEDQQQQQQQQGEDQGFGQGQDQGQDQGQGQDQMGQQGQDQQGQGQQGAGDQGSEGLQQEQQALRDRLQELQKRLREAGQGEQGLDEADRAMQDAERGLAQGGDKGNGAAEDAQGRAIEGMRKGAEQLAEKMRGQGNGNGDEGSPEAQEEGGTDPLGRPMGGDSTFNPNSRYDPMGVPAAQRAQRVLEELRRRLSDPSRPQEELDYLERLLRRY